jgi:hypothetical protein
MQGQLPVYFSGDNTIGIFFESSRFGVEAPLLWKALQFLKAVANHQCIVIFLDKSHQIRKIYCTGKPLIFDGKNHGSKKFSQPDPKS